MKGAGGNKTQTPTQAQFVDCGTLRYRAVGFWNNLCLKLKVNIQISPADGAAELFFFSFLFFSPSTQLYWESVVACPEL